MTFDQYIGYLVEATKSVDTEQINNFIELIVDAYNVEKTIFIIGNGGSAASASHLAQDLAKGARSDVNATKRIRAISLTDNIAFITALGNDFGYDIIFEQQLRTFAKPGDILIAISGSGNSPNIIKAVDWANKNSLVTVGITGFDGGKLKQINTHSLHVELNDMCTAESIHSVLLHYIVIEIQKRIKIMDVV